jgi:uncharacterized protein YbbK (DUF523 family)
VLLAHHPERLALLREPTPDAPWRVLVSGCLAGLACGVDGTDYGLPAALGGLLSLPTLRTFPFCPEDYGLGTPRTMPDIHGGDGFDVLDGRARVLDEHGTDCTEGMLRGARAMLDHARQVRAELAIVTDMSAACGSQVISDGCRLVEQRAYQVGVGVATALLLREGLDVVSQRDFSTLGALRARLEPGFVPDPAALDHHHHPWVRAHLGTDLLKRGRTRG